MPGSVPQPLAGAGARARRGDWLAFAVVAAVYAAVAMHQATMSGVYMDEVNPDYLVVRLLNWTGPPVPAWVLPGNYLLDRFPVLVSLQHGTQSLWLGAPAFWLLGTTVASLRFAHALFALAVLAALYALLGRSGVRRWWAIAACVALAIDPTFVYAFRTQNFITTAPAAWLLLSLYALQRAGAGAGRERAWLAASGLFHGLAFAGYFVYLFVAPAVALAVVAWDLPGATGRQRLARLAWWCGGFGAGALPYVVGYALLLESQGGFAAGWAYIVSTQATLGNAIPVTTLQQRYAHFEMILGQVFGNAANHWPMFGAPGFVPGAGAKTALLLALPPLLWVVAEFRRCAPPMLRLLLGMQVAFAAGALLFGGRLSGHHYMPLVPLAYAALAVASAALLADEGATGGRRWLVGVPFTLLLALNAAGSAGEAATLRRTGGVGLYSDAINTFAADLLRERPRDVVFLPDWGLLMPAAFLTGGKVELVSLVEDYAAARHFLCGGRDVSVALVTGDRAARLDAWQRELGGVAPSSREYRQRDGAVVFVLGSFSARDYAPRCGAGAAAAPAAR